MKRLSIVKLSVLITAIFIAAECYSQTTAINWRENQLMEPAALANIITNKTDSVIIICVGPFNTIPNAIDVGMVSEKEGLEKFKTQLSTIDKNKKIVIYCGCCPFEHCPNIRPAIDVLKQMNFMNYYLLNLPHNIKIDWIDKAYPVTKL